MLNSELKSHTKFWDSFEIFKKNAPMRSAKNVLLMSNILV